MLNPSVLVAALVAKLQAIPEVVTELGENASNIVAYEDAYPSATTIAEAIYNQPNPSIIAAWNGTSPGNYKRGEVWVHRFSFYCKTGNVYTDLWAAIVNGIPSSSLDDGQPFRRTSIHSSCDIIGALSCDRRQLYVSEFSTIDYFEISFSLVERGADR